MKKTRVSKGLIVWAMVFAMMVSTFSLTGAAFAEVEASPGKTEGCGHEHDETYLFIEGTECPHKSVETCAAGSIHTTYEVVTLAEVDKSMLLFLIQAAQAMNQSNYTPASWVVLQTALDGAISVAGNGSATQDDVDAAMQTLSSVLSALATPGDKSALHELITQAQALNQSNYTSASWADLQTALTEARRVYGDVNALQAEVDDASDALNSAIGSLVIPPAETPVISVQPQAADYEVGDTPTSLFVTASVGMGTLSYQWFSNTTDSTANGTPVGTSQSYAPPTSAAGILYYYVVVTNTDGLKTSSETSAAAAITVAPVSTYAIAATAGTGGSISPGGRVVVNKGSSQTFVITPNAGYAIADVKADGTSVGAVASYTFRNITADHTISVDFRENTSAEPAPPPTTSGGSSAGPQAGDESVPGLWIVILVIAGCGVAGLLLWRRGAFS